MERRPPHLMLIGLDGLNLRLVRQLLPPEVMPTLARLLHEGASGPLRSVLPTHSAAAWATFMTGRTPAGHGVFEFTVRGEDGRFHHARPELEQTMWHALGRCGYRGGVFNFPVTFPPMPIRGWMVAGMLSPSLDRLSAPPGLAAELLARFPDYRLDVEWAPYEGRPEALLARLTAMVQQRGEVARFLLARQPLDYFAVAFVATDRAQHAIWRFLDPEHPTYDAGMAAELRPAIHAFYRSLDEAVSALLQEAGPETRLMLLSDHGFQAAAWQMHVDEWLASQGWLVYRRGAGRLGRWLRRLDRPRVQAWRRRLVKDVSRHLPALAPEAAIDWEHTRAFCPWHFHQGVRLNVRGREPHGLVQPGGEYEALRQEMAGRLSALRHPELGLPVVAQVYRREELYQGDQLEQMPDLIFALQPGFAIGPHHPSLFGGTGWASGDHSLEGFVCLAGPGVKPGLLAGAALEDVAPTVLNLFHVPVPAAMQGRPWEEMAAPTSAPLPLESLAGPHGQAPSSPDGSALSEADESALLERLRNLGYL